jgi:hypothetical protein
MQFPVLHEGVPFIGAAQTRSQLPQCTASDDASKQPSVHWIAGLTHSSPQLPPMQVGRAFGAPGQTAPQVPQWAVSVSVSTQLPEHSSVPVGQVASQAAPEQKRPAGHTVVQPPQCCPSLSVSTHAPSQSV